MLRSGFVIAAAVLLVLAVSGLGLSLLANPTLVLGALPAEWAYRLALVKRSWQVEPDPRAPLPAARSMRPLRAIAHRGASRVAPENTLPAIRAALELGAEFIELDVRETADGIAVLMHDATVDRTTSGIGQVAELTLAELQQLDAGSWFGAAFVGTRVPTLRDALALIRGRACVVWDLKTAPSRATIDEFRAAGYAHSCLRVLSGKQGPEWQHRRAQLIWLWPEANLMPVLRSATDMPRLVEDHPNASAVWIPRGLDPARVVAAQAAGFEVFTTADFDWDARPGYEKIYAAGFDAILLDNFAAFNDFRRAVEPQ